LFYCSIMISCLDTSFIDFQVEKITAK